MPKETGQAVRCGLCGSDRVQRQKDIGWDIDENGEERQHRDICLGCGAERFWTEAIIYGIETKTHIGPWREARRP